MDLKSIEAAVSYVQAKLPEVPRVGFVLGSGLGTFADILSDRIVVPYMDIPNFPIPKVQGHAGRLVYGKVGNTSVVVLQGRVHLYEGWSLEQVVFGVRVVAKLGVTWVVLTNAAGGVNPEYNPGDVMIISDHLNMLGANPLVGSNEDSIGERFPDMSSVYDSNGQNILEGIAEKEGLVVRRGVYAAMLGPSYETPAEIKMLQTLGADVVGMSTVPEAIALRHMGVNVAGISLITNKAAGISQSMLSHEEVQKTASQTASKFVGMLQKIAIDL